MTYNPMTYDPLPLELEGPTGKTLAADLRPLVPEPPPVRLVAVADVHLPAADDLSAQLNGFYADLLGFERRYGDEDVIVYHAEKFRLFFDLVAPPVDRENIRPVGVEVRSLPLVIFRLNERRIEFRKLRGILTGQTSLLVQDPAGNWVELTERKEVM